MFSTPLVPFIIMKPSMQRISMKAQARIAGYGFFATLLGAMGFVHFVAAEGATGTDIRPNMMQERRTEMRENVGERRQAAQARTLATSTDASTRRDTVLEKKELLRSEMQERMDRVRTEHQKKMDEHAARKETFRGEAEARLRALHKRLSEDRAERIEEFFGRMVERYERMTERLSDFADRLEAHIDRLERSGADMTAGKTALGDARLKINEALAKLDAVRGGYSDFADDTDLRRAFGQKVRETVKTLNTAIREAHQALIHAAQAIRQATGGVERQRPQETATSTGNSS